MPAYAFKGLSANGKSLSGVRDAESPRALRGLLKKEGIFVTDLSESAKQENVKLSQREFSFKKLFDRVKIQDVAVSTQQLATLLRSGIPLAESLSALLDQASTDRLREIFAKVRTRVNEGSALADAFEDHKDVFPPLYINMVRAGETAGNLEEVLERLAEFLDAQVRLRSKVQSAMVYPIVMAVVGIVVVGLLMAVVVPKITQIFADSNKALPWNTQLLIWISDIVANWWWAIIILAGLGIYLFQRWKKTPEGKATWDAIVLRVWLFGPLVRIVGVARFSRTLGTLLSSGVPLLRALEIVESILENTVLVRVVENARKAIREGESIAEQLEKSKEFPPVVTRMIAVGERSGQLEAMLNNVAAAQEREVEVRITRLTSLMEPVMIIVMAVGVGFILFSILMPILQMNEIAG